MSNMRTRKKPKSERFMTVMGNVVLDRHNNCERVPAPTVDVSRAGDYGADPLGDGMFRMVPSGDVVDNTERARRLGK